MNRGYVLLAAVLLIVVVPGALGDSPAELDDRLSSDEGEEDAGESRSSATEIQPGSHEGNLTRGLDGRDVFAFEVEAGEAFGVQGTTFAESRGDPTILGPELSINGDVEPTLISPDGERIPVGLDHWEQPNQFHYGETRFLALPAEPAGTWLLSVNVTPDPRPDAGTFLGIHATVPVTASYEFQLDTVVRPDQDDAGSGRDAGTTLESAASLPNGTSEGTAGPADETDVYTFDADEGSFVSLIVRPGADLTGKIEVGPGGRTALEDRFRPGHPGVVIYQAPEDGPSRVDVSLDPPAEAFTARSYEIELERGRSEVFPCQPQDDGSSGGDAPSSEDVGAVGLGTGEVDGCLSRFDVEDTYRARLDPGDRIRLEVTEDTCERARDLETHIDVDLYGGRDWREASCEQGVEGRSFEFTAEHRTEVDVAVEAHVDRGALNYTLVVERETVPLPDPHVAEIDDGVHAEVGTPAGDVPFPNPVTDTEPLELRRQRDVAVTISNLGEGPATRDVEVRLYAAPEDCVLPEPVGFPFTPLERSRCDPERILTGQAADLDVNQTVTFGGTWDTTHTIGEQRLFATLNLNGGPDLDRSNNQLEETTPVLIGTDKGMN